MEFLSWMGLVGAMLLFMALASAYVRRLPITTAVVYLAIGFSLSPAVFNVVTLDFVAYSVWFEHLTEIAVILSLFVGGLKLRLPLKDPVWRAAYRLAGPVMVASIAGVAAFAHFVLGVEWPIAVLLGAVLAPTDPVLASTVTVNNSKDHDRTRFGLSGEAGFNDGAAFPFVVFALLWSEQSELGGWIGEWVLHRLIWAVPVGLLIGYFAGKSLGRLAIWLRGHHKDTESPNDFLALAVIALVYFGAQTVGAWGFLAAFAAGLGFRQAERRIAELHPIGAVDKDGSKRPSLNSADPPPPAEELAGQDVKEGDLEEPTMVAGLVIAEVVSFGDIAERLIEVATVVLLGLALGVYWTWEAVPLALALFFIIRPLATMALLAGTPATRLQRLVMGWFGIRGIGSLYYLAYALNHGLEEQVPETVSLALSVVALSILLHGISSQPILDYYERRLRTAKT